MNGQGRAATAGARREMGLAMAGAVVAGGLALSSAGQSWAAVTVVRRPPLPPVGGLATGGQVAPLVPAAGLLLLAAAVALVAVRGTGRLAVGLLMAASGSALCWSGLRPLTGRLAVDAASTVVSGGSPEAEVAVSVHAAWPALAVVAGGLGILTGLLAVLRGRRWPAMGRRYERPAGSGAPAAGRPSGAGSAEDRAAAAWRALDRGEDPTGSGEAPY